MAEVRFLFGRGTYNLYRKILFGNHTVSLHKPVTSARSYSSAHSAIPLCKTKSGYYDLLEVSPSATYAQIKTAYYNKSFQFHPDRNLGSEEATAKFAEVSEAYIVLGNKHLRRKYDRGILSPRDLQHGVGIPRFDAGGQQKQARQSTSATSPLQPTISNIDTFLQDRYKQQLELHKATALKKKERLKAEEEEYFENVKDSIVVISFCLACVFLLCHADNTQMKKLTSFFDPREE
ncbi:hypothetical protein DNTS_033605 [Danionella cerebrum]|uniref:J domain-containing protein n=1 Tax=Danionella cerebrum TaxID=2873325 RepID=A0A553RC41_9TELE|nr:hypothetical protein DNTS_033605 [Danionella translucida]